jgi:outer membrane cobalamin receptor
MGLLQSVGERTKLRAGWGRYFQSQAINELQISDGVTQFHPPQRADHWDGSIEYAHDSGIDLRLEAYWKEYTDLRPRYENLLNSFVLLPELKPYRIRVAPETASARGIEFTVSRRSGRPLNWWFTYTWSSVRDDFADAEIERSWDQTNAVGAGLAWQTERWDAVVAGTYRTGWPTTDFELATTDPLPLVSTGPRNANRLGSYSSIDVRVARKFQFERAGELTVFLEITNLFNQSNDCCVEFEFNDEEAPSGLETETSNYLPAFPSLGVIWRF